MWKRRALERGTTAPGAIAAQATQGLASATSGIGFVYEILEDLRRRTGADDLIAVVEAVPFGRQVFRAGRHPIDSDWSRDVVEHGRVGLHGTPGPVDPTVGETVVSLCEVALRLDVAVHDAAHDHLTGLLNRRSFDEQFAAACARSDRYGWPFALVLLDIDGFKAVNDRLGHATGDAMLRAVGMGLVQNVRGGDVAARLGGDEFALILANACEVDCRALTDRVGAAVRLAVPAASVMLSIGAALAPIDGTTIDALYQRADAALYEHKRRTR